MKPLLDRLRRALGFDSGEDERRRAEYTRQTGLPSTRGPGLSRGTKNLLKGAGAFLVLLVVLFGLLVGAAPGFVRGIVTETSVETLPQITMTQNVTMTETFNFTSTQIYTVYTPSFDPPPPTATVSGSMTCYAVGCSAKSVSFQQDRDGNLGTPIPSTLGSGGSYSVSVTNGALYQVTLYYTSVLGIGQSCIAAYLTVNDLQGMESYSGGC